jgi:hypothetical protein
MGFSKSTMNIKHQINEFPITKKRNSIVDHKEEYSLSHFFFNKNGDYSVNKIYVSKLIQKIFKPIEKSYYTLNDLIMIKLSTFENMEELNELPELITNKGLKDIDNLYLKLGYKKPGTPLSKSPVKHKIRPKIKAKVANGLQAGHG